MSKYAFEARIPLDHVKEGIKILRAGELMLKKSTLLILIGCTSGELGALLASFEAPPLFADVPLPTTLEGVVTELETILEASPEVAPESSISSEPGVAAAINPLVILLIQQFIKLLLERLA